MINRRRILECLRYCLGFLIVLLAGIAIVFGVTIWLQSVFAETMASFRGTTQSVFFNQVTTTSSAFWSVGDAYLCVPPSLRRSLPEDLFQHEENEKSCGAGDGARLIAISLGGDVSVSFEEPTNIAVRLHSLPDGGSYISISGRNKLEDNTKCKNGTEGLPTIHTVLPGATKFKLPHLVELRSIVSVPVVMPFTGLITVGGQVVDDNAFLLNSGTGATYVEDGDDMRLVNSTEIFPGDRVRFADNSGCYIRSTGFVRLERSGDIDTLQVISSARMAGAVLSVERVSTFGEDGNGRQKYINFGANLLDKILIHRLIVWLGAAITSLVICVELYSLTSEYLTSGGAPLQLDGDLPQSQGKARPLVTSVSKISLKPRRAKRRS